MRRITPLDLRRSLGSILDAASAGERFLVERDHRPLAFLVSVEDGQRLDESADELRQRRLGALALLDEHRERMARLYPRRADGPSGAELIRRDRARDDADE
jgi:antitoxin (DNA-binding transcriptional repressor) of toxin-antitoxin stability system